MLGGAIDGNNAKKKQEKAQKAAQNQQIDLQKEQMQMAKDRIADFDKNYAPLEQLLIDRAKRGQQADLGGVTARANADINQQFANSLATQQRNLGRLGFNQSLKLAGSDEAAALARAKALAGGITSARENERRSADAQSVDMLSKVTQIGVNKLNNAQSSLDNSMTNLANSYGTQATNQMNSANSMLAGAGQIGGTLLQDYLANKNQTGLNSGSPVIN
jgi:cellobiose-specific phosphotransferase system component IIA